MRRSHAATTKMNESTHEFVKLKQIKAAGQLEAYNYFKNSTVLIVSKGAREPGQENGNCFLRVDLMSWVETKRNKPVNPPLGVEVVFREF